MRGPLTVERCFDGRYPAKHSHFLLLRCRLESSRVYAVYGGVFVVLSLAWGWMCDGQTPDRFDTAGALLCLAGVALMMYVPRG